MIVSSSPDPPARPDIFVGAHDQLGGLVASGIVAPVDLGAKAWLYAPRPPSQPSTTRVELRPPYSVENIALIRNSALVPEAPATWADLETVALGLSPTAPSRSPGHPADAG